MSEVENKQSTSFIRETRDVTISNAATHDEIIITKNEWENICEKIKQITIKRKFDFSNILLGLFFSKGVDLLYDLYKGDLPSLIPITIYGCLCIVYMLLTKYFNIFKIDNDESNQIHLNDIKQWIQKINEKCN